MNLIFFILTCAVCKIASCEEAILSSVGYRSSYRTFLLNNGKTYRSEEEREKRFQIWKRNYEYIERHNQQADAGNHTYWLKMNRFGDMTPIEITELAKGYNMALKQNLQNIFENRNQVGSHTLSGVNNPKRIDLREKGIVTSVKDQGSCGSCWAFAAVASIEGSLANTTGQLLDLSEQHLLDCTRSSGNMGCEGGYPVNAIKFAIANGLRQETVYPYEGFENRCPVMKESSDSLIRVRKLMTIPKGSERALQDSLANSAIVAAGIDSSHPSFAFYSRGVYYEPRCSQVFLDHAVTVVGYSSSRGRDYWIVKNSWGMEWGQNGYIWMSRNLRNNCGIATDSVYALV